MAHGFTSLQLFHACFELQAAELGIPWYPIPGATGIVTWTSHWKTNFYWNILWYSIHTDIFYHYSAYIMSFASRQASALQTRPPWRTMAPPTAPAAASGGPRPRRQCGGRRRRGRRGPWRSSPCSTGTNKQGSLAHCIVALVKFMSPATQRI